MSHFSELSASHIIHILVVEDEMGQREYVLDQPIYTIGKSPRSDIRLCSEPLLNVHATIVQLPVQLPDDSNLTHRYRIIDGNLRGRRSNQLRVNKHLVVEYDLQHGDTIEFAPFVRAYYYRTERNQLGDTAAGLINFKKKMDSQK